MKERVKWKKLYNKPCSVLSEDSKAYLIYFLRPIFHFFWSIKVYVYLFSIQFCGTRKIRKQLYVYLDQSSEGEKVKVKKSSKKLRYVLESSDKTEQDLFYNLFHFTRSFIA